MITDNRYVLEDTTGVKQFFPTLKHLKDYISREPKLLVLRDELKIYEMEFHMVETEETKNVNLDEAYYTYKFVYPYGYKKNTFGGLGTAYIDWYSRPASGLPITASKVLAKFIASGVQNEFEYAIFYGRMSDARWNTIIKYFKGSDIPYLGVKPVIFTNNRSIIPYMLMQENKTEKTWCVRIQDLIDTDMDNLKKLNFKNYGDLCTL